MSDDTQARDGRHDFDFLHGHWQVRNERLRQRLAGSDDWEIFHARQSCEPVLGGLGNVDAFLSDWRRPGQADDFQGMTLRLFDLQRRQWNIWWAGSHDGVLEPPVAGGFERGVGVFEGELEHDGEPVRARFQWSGIGAHTAHWQQAFSRDGGASWETNWHMWLRRRDDDGRLRHDDAVIELRRYLMRPGRRDDLIELFEREFVESQEAVGMHVIGQFRELDAADRYTWVRGFPSHALRAESLQGFYGGPTWRAHRDAANATLLDNDDVRLLKPARPDCALPAAAHERAPVGARGEDGGIVCVGVCELNAPAQDGFLQRFERGFAPLLEPAGLELLGVYVTDDTPNGYPRLPVREGEPALVWFARCDDAEAPRRLAADAGWRAAVADALLADLKAAPQLLRLAPTARSELRA
ncbi:NIPSNAP family protein [Lysobacter enzymogenes]|uniref:NIPSNAP family protein n=1 Tax=Lysobacter enzymogenes TaxID=69 RepID=UPI001A971EB3|nr:NIPSNAP family protein [Lysobacter enzymogenes]QQP94805.1 NIPSNAP family protein [Lysobacter enzymogenes]